MAIPLVFAAGMGIDYGLAARTEGRLNAVADAAALAAITPSMMVQSTAAATAAAQNMFNAQAAGIPGVQSAPNLTVNVKDSGLTRTAQVTYAAQVQNAFAGIYGQYTTAIGGSSSASATAAPNIDFYLLLDSSPSMAIAATTAGINTMVANTPKQGGCAFGCHETNPAADNLGNPGGEDNYMLAKNLGVTLRIDNLRSAVQNLTTTAQTVMASNTAKYRMAIYTFDVAFNMIKPLTSNLATAQSDAAKIQLLQVYSNNWLTKNNNNNDTDTNYDNAMNNINSTMPNPGAGTNVKGDTPQEVMFFVTDGVEDENISGARQQSLMSTSWCTTIKNRGIRIAVVYTTYFPLPTNSWYNDHIAPFQSQIGPNMQSCASPGLYFEVNTDQDISTAMNALFQKAVASAHLTK